MSERRTQSLALVSAGLGLDGGGRALVGRLLARGVRDYARAHGLDFEILSLGSSNEPQFAPTRHFAGDRRGLASAVLRLQRRRGKSPALVFDLLGLARVQTLLPARWRSRYLVTLYGIEVWRKLTWSRRRALLGADIQLAISRHTLERALPFTGALDQAMLVRLTLEPDEREAAEAAAAADAALLDQLGEDYILIVGRLDSRERYKGHEELLQALVEVAQQVPSARLVVVGDGDDRQHLEQRAAEIGVGARTTFTGFVSAATLREVYRHAGVFAMPSTGEGFGLVWVEAMRECIPCVALTGSVAEEVIVDGETGLLVPPGNPAALVAALVRLLTDVPLRQRFGDAGKAHAEASFGYASFEHTLGAALDRLIA